MQHVPVVEHFLAGPVFRYFLFPIGSALFGIWTKMEIRGRPKREDLAVGPELIRGSLLMLVALTCARATSLDATHQSLNVVKDPIEIAQLQAHATVASTGLDWIGIMIFLTGMLLSLTTGFIRVYGWEPDPQNPASTRLRLSTGIVIPGLVGLGTLYLVAWFLSG